MTDGLTFNTLRRANLKRLPMFRNSRGETVHSSDDGSDWSPAQWLQAAVGELGEYANLRKKVERGDFSLAEARPELGNELADVVIYLDILAAQLGIDLGQAVMSKWNAVSERVAAPIYIDAEDWHWRKRPSVRSPEFPKPTAEAPEAKVTDGAVEAGEGKERGHDPADALDVASLGTGGQQTPASASQTSPALDGSYRRFGEDGPVYQVVALKDHDQAKVEFPESGETVDLPVETVLRDPVVAKADE